MTDINKFDILKKIIYRLDLIGDSLADLQSTVSELMEIEEENGNNGVDYNELYKKECTKNVCLSNSIDLLETKNEKMEQRIKSFEDDQDKELKEKVSKQNEELLTLRKEHTFYKKYYESGEKKRRKYTEDFKDM